MFHLISMCLGSFGAGSSFECSRRRAVCCDWNVPCHDDINNLLVSLKGKNPNLCSQTAMNLILSNLESDDVCGEAPFKLKHLFIFDHAVDELLCLDKIGHYYNSSFLLEPQDSPTRLKLVHRNSISLDGFIDAYYSYIRNKAKFYASLPRAQEILSSRNRIHRKQFLKLENSRDLIETVSKCLKIAAQLFLISKIYNSLPSFEKNNELLKHIIVWNLKNILLVYTIISTSLVVLFTRLQQLSIWELSKLKKHAFKYNREFIFSFMSCLHQNKGMQGFKDVKYTQILPLGASVLKIIQKCIQKSVNNGRDSFIEEQVESRHIVPRQISQLPDIPALGGEDEFIIRFKPRKIIQIAPQEDLIFDRGGQTFEEYNNHYHKHNSQQDVSTESECSTSVFNSGLRSPGTTHLGVDRASSKRQRNGKSCTLIPQNDTQCRTKWMAWISTQAL